MNSVIISTRDTHGGAAIAAARLQMGLNDFGICTHMLVKHKKSTLPGVIQAPAPTSSEHEDLFKRFQKHYIDRNRTSLTNTKFSISYTATNTSFFEISENIDIINIHFISSFLSVESIHALLSLGKPVVWTLHDQWPFTGGCHYSAGCKGYTQDCGNCPQLVHDPLSITQRMLQEKADLDQYPNLCIVSPSQWLAHEAKSSIVFKNTPVHVIPNGINTRFYRPLPKTTALRDKLHIPRDATTILFGAQSGAISRKGFQQLTEALAHCSQFPEFKKKADCGQIVLLLFGKPNANLDKLNIPYRSLDHIEDEGDMVNIYRSSDLFLLPSQEDNLPNTMLEAMACGTPVIAFAIGGMPDVIEDHISGRLIPHLDTFLFAKAITDLVIDPVKRKRMGLLARERITCSFTLEQQASQYHHLFNLLLKKSPARSAQTDYPPSRFHSRHSELLNLFSSALRGIPKNLDP